jgi:molybdate transport system substrate-binding protein
LIGIRSPRLASAIVGSGALLLRVGTAALAATVGAFLSAGPAAAADVRVICPSALRAPMVESARSFARAGGHRVEFVFASVASVHKRIASGERADVAIGTAQGADALMRLGRAVEGTFVTLVRSALALALPPGALMPAIGDPASLSATLRQAQTVVIPDASLGVPGGAQTAELLQRLGLTEELRPHTRSVADAREVAKRVAAGDAQIGIGSMSDLAQAPGVAVLGPITEPATQGIEYAAVVVRGSTRADVAQAFIVHLRSAASQALFRKAGYLPVD